MKKWHFIVIIVSVALGAGLLMLDRWLHPYDLATELAAARAAGIATTPAGLKPAIPPPGQDAAPYWLTLARHATHGPPLAHDSEMALIHQALSKSGAYFPHKWTPDELFPEFAVMRDSVKKLTAESVGTAAKGRYVEAVQNQALGYRAARHAATEPILIAYLFNLAVDHITTEGLSEILARSGPNPAVSAAIRQAMDAHPLYHDVEPALQGEALFMAGAGRSIRSVADIMALSGTPPGSISSLARIRFPAGLWRHFVLEPNEAAYRHFSTRSILAARAPAPLRKKALDRIEHDIAALPALNPSFYAAKYLFPIFSGVYDKHFRSLAERRVLLAATYVMDYRSRHGRWPPRLEDAMPNPPLDPFTGKRLAYRQAAGGFVVKSIGDPGATRPAPMVFRYPAPASKGTP